MAMPWQNDPAQLAAMQSAAPNATSGNIPDYLKNMPGMMQTLAQNPSVMGHQEQVADPMAAMHAAGNGNDQYQWFNNHPQYQNNIRGAMGAGFSPWYSGIDNNGGAASSGTGLNYGGAPMPGRGGPGLPPPSPMQAGGAVPPMMSPGDPMQGPQAKMGMASAGMGYRPPGMPSGPAQGMASAGGGSFNEQTGQPYGASPRPMPPQAMMAQALRSRMRLR